MAGLEDMIRRAERSLGISDRPNGITKWYASRNGRVFARAAWCDQSITYWAFHSGNHDAVCFGRDYAYTVWHAQRFSNRGQWHTGTAGIRRGDIVFFDWAGSRRIPAIDHVAIVTGVEAGGVRKGQGGGFPRQRPSALGQPGPQGRQHRQRREAAPTLPEQGHAVRPGGRWRVRPENRGGCEGVPEEGRRPDGRWRVRPEHGAEAPRRPRRDPLTAEPRPAALAGAGPALALQLAGSRRLPLAGRATGRWP